MKERLIISNINLVLKMLRRNIRVINARMSRLLIGLIVIISAIALTGSREKMLQVTINNIMGLVSKIGSFLFLS